MPHLATSPVQTVLERLDAVSRRGQGWIARCPAHADNRPSLKVDEGKDGRALLTCYAGCEPATITEAIGLTMADLFVHDDRRSDPPRPFGVVGRVTYDYRDATGALVCQEVRDPPKRFWLRRPDGHGGWIANLDGVDPPLYALPELLANPERWVALPEGAKDADRLRSLGLLATTTVKGANAPWLDSYSETLRGRSVAILADNDPAGIACAHKRAQALSGIAGRVKVVLLSDLPPKGDVSDWLDAGHTKDELIRLLRDAPDWTTVHAKQAPSTDADQPHAELVVYSMADVEAKPVDWIGPGWLAKSEIHILGAHPGVGKSTLTLWLAATLSNGGTLPDGIEVHAPTTNTLLALAEDNLSTTVRPRLDLHKADLDRVTVIDLVRDEQGRERGLNLREHIELLRTHVVTNNIGLLVIDPISSFMPKADRNNERDVRDVVTPLRKMAESTGVAVLGVMHIGKPSGVSRNPLQMLLGSTGFGAVARVVWMVAELPEDHQPKHDPKDDGDTHRVLEVVKTNIAMPPRALRWSRPLDRGIQWHGLSTVGVSEALAGAPKERAVDVAAAFLEEVLAGGSPAADELFREGEARGISEKTLRRAKEHLNVERFKERGVTNGRWFWKLPNGSPPDDGTAAEDGQSPVDMEVAILPPRQDVAKNEDGHSENVAIFPEYQEDGQSASSGHLDQVRDWEIEDGQVPCIDKLAIFDPSPAPSDPQDDEPTWEDFG